MHLIMYYIIYSLLQIEICEIICIIVHRCLFMEISKIINLYYRCPQLLTLPGHNLAPSLYTHWASIYVVYSMGSFSKPNTKLNV